MIEYPELPPVDDADFELLAENQAAVKAFFVLDDSAWQFSSMGEIICLDYLAADVIWRRLSLELDSDAFAGVMLFSKTIANLLRND
ncbi:MAG: hypothetical protein EPN89_05375 [Methylovulum sp.]|nr:MAG: hypothetical protein EPN89_05375 [Methylovulum sp.]